MKNVICHNLSPVDNLFYCGAVKPESANRLCNVLCLYTSHYYKCILVLWHICFLMTVLGLNFGRHLFYTPQYPQNPLSYNLVILFSVRFSVSPHPALSLPDIQYYKLFPRFQNFGQKFFRKIAAWKSAVYLLFNPKRSLDFVLISINWKAAKEFSKTGIQQTSKCPIAYHMGTL